MIVVPRLEQKRALPREPNATNGDDVFGPWSLGAFNWYVHRPTSLSHVTFANLFDLLIYESLIVVVWANDEREEEWRVVSR